MSARSTRSSCRRRSSSRSVILSRSSGVYTCFGERTAGHAFRDPGLVEVLRDAAEEERPAGAEDQRRVDVLRLRDDVLVEHVTDLVGDRLERVSLDLVDVPAGIAAYDDLVAALGVVAQRLGEREAIGVGLVERLEHVVYDARADHLEEH